MIWGTMIVYAASIDPTARTSYSPYTAAALGRGGA